MIALNYFLWGRCYAWEQSFHSKVLSIRNDELSWFRRAQLLAAVSPKTLFFNACNGMIESNLGNVVFSHISFSFCFWNNIVTILFMAYCYVLQLNTFMLNSIPVVVTVVSFGMYTLLGGDLTPAKAFTSLSLFSVLRFPLFMLPNVVTQVYYSLNFFDVFFLEKRL